MNQYSEKERVLYKDFVDVVCGCDDWGIYLLDPADHDRTFNAWYDLYNTNHNLALKTLFYLRSRECPFRNNDLSNKLLDHFSETEPEECKAIINAGLIEKYASSYTLLSLLGNDDDDIDRCVIDHLARLIIREALENVDPDNLEFHELKCRIGRNENATRYFEKYYGIEPELWSDQTKDSRDCENSKYDLSPLNEYEIDFLAGNDAE